MATSVLMNDRDILLGLMGIKLHSSARVFHDTCMPA
jgi:hypothetical protein